MAHNHIHCEWQKPRMFVVILQWNTIIAPRIQDGNAIGDHLEYLMAMTYDPRAPNLGTWIYVVIWSTRKKLIHIRQLIDNTITNADTKTLRDDTTNN